jgi:hypothetical protein
MTMTIPGSLLTTAMAVMPHRDVDRALETALTMDIPSLTARLEDIWSALGKKGIDRDFLFSRSLISPATCCLVNPDGDKTVDKAFAVVKALSEDLRETYRL